MYIFCKISKLKWAPSYLKKAVFSVPFCAFLFLRAKIPPIDSNRVLFFFSSTSFFWKKRLEYKERESGYLALIWQNNDPLMLQHSFGFYLRAAYEQIDLNHTSKHEYKKEFSNWN